MNTALRSPLHRRMGLILPSTGVKQPAPNISATIAQLLACPSGYMRVNGQCVPSSVSPIENPGVFSFLGPPTETYAYPIQNQPYTVNQEGLPWNAYTSYNPGDTVTYAGSTWQALTYVPAGYAPGTYGYWQQLTLSALNTVQVPGVGTVATGVDPTTGIVYSSVPPSGPQPPGAGYQQIEQSGAYPYVYIGGGATSQNYEGLPWSPTTQYNPGDTVTYNGVTWQALTTVPPGVYPGLAGYWQQSAYGSLYSSLYPGLYPNTAPTTTAAASAAGVAAPSVGTSFSSWFAQNEGLVIGGGLGLVGLIVLLRMSKR